MDLSRPDNPYHLRDDPPHCPRSATDDVAIVALPPRVTTAPISGGRRLTRGSFFVSGEIQTAKGWRTCTLRLLWMHSCERSELRESVYPEEGLITELLKIIDQIDINELGMKTKLGDEIKRFSHFQRTAFGSDGTQEADEAEVNILAYAKYLLRQGNISEKRELPGNLRSRLVYRNKRVSLMELAATH